MYLKVEATFKGPGFVWAWDLIEVRSEVVNYRTPRVRFQWMIDERTRDDPHLTSSGGLGLGSLWKEGKAKGKERRRVRKERTYTNEAKWLQPRERERESREGPLLWKQVSDC